MTEPTEAKENPVESFVDHVQDALKIVQFKAEQIDKTAKDESAFVMGLVIIALSGIALAIGRFDFQGLVFNPVLAVVFAFIWTGLLHLLATLLFKGEGDFIEFFRPISHAYIVLWVVVIPFFWFPLGLIAEIWAAAVSVLIVERIYGLDRGKAIATVAIPIGAFFLLLFVFGGMMLFWLMLRGVGW